MPYKLRSTREFDDVDERPSADDFALMAPMDSENGVLGRAVREGNYRNFRVALEPSEEWVRKRVGRWIQRFPEAEWQLGQRLFIGDVVEEVYLLAFEAYQHRPTAVPLHEWLEGLVNPALKKVMEHPDEERENASFARTVRDTRQLR